MAVKPKPFEIEFPLWFGECAQFKAQSKGYLPDVEVSMEDGRRFRLFFIEPTRLSQDLEAGVQCGKPAFTETNLVVVPEITVQAIHSAVAVLVADDEFAHFKPLP